MKNIKEDFAIILTIINIIGTITITLLIILLDKDKGFIIIIINIIPQICCIILLIDFCVDKCCVNYKACVDKCIYKMHVNNCAGLIIFCIVFLVFIIIFGFFALFTDIIGKHISRYCSLGTIIFLELGISLYSLFLIKKIL